MAFGANVSTLVGQLGQDVEVKYVSGGRLAVGRARFATSEMVKKGNNRIEETEWHNLVFFGRQAEVVRDYAKQGSRLWVEGKIHYANWEHGGKKYYRTEIHVRRMQLLDRRGTNVAEGQPGAPDDEGYDPGGYDDFNMPDSEPLNLDDQ